MFLGEGETIQNKEKKDLGCMARRGLWVSSEIAIAMHDKVAFLATTVGPRVAAACAHASLIALSEENALAAASGFIIPPEGSGHGNR
ncbi:hypothetical protein CK203_005444 [Vitis vinifera]|uniref:Uncharacterized protein n=1 Tax=Vitis vinifera TaxID=29760 RepID=A0A438K3U2_VITVI|nr:hypothetical protein CK203_005444 [Vitis vinifera]